MYVFQSFVASSITTFFSSFFILIFVERCISVLPVFTCSFCIRSETCFYFSFSFLSLLAFWRFRFCSLNLFRYDFSFYWSFYEFCSSSSYRSCTCSITLHSISYNWWLAQVYLRKEVGWALCSLFLPSSRCLSGRFRLSSFESPSAANQTRQVEAHFSYFEELVQGFARQYSVQNLFSVVHLVCPRPL